MQNKKILDSWSKIEPDGLAKERMLVHILKQINIETESKNLKVNNNKLLRRLTPLVACTVVTVFVIYFGFNLTNNSSMKIPKYKVIAGNFDIQNESNYTPFHNNSSSVSSKSQDEDAGPLSAVNIGTYIGVNGYPDYLGGFYVSESGETVALLYKDSPEIRSKLIKIAESKDIKFKEATYSYNYLSSLSSKLADSMSNKTLPFVIGGELDDKKNRLRVYITSVDKEKLLQLAKLDVINNGDALDIYLVIKQDRMIKDDKKVNTKTNNSSAMSKLKKVDQSAGSQRITFTLTNDTNENLYFGNKPQLEIQSNGKWETVKTKDDAAWDDIAHALQAKQEKDYTVNLTNYYNTLKKGHYRYMIVLRGNDKMLASISFDID